MQADSTRSLYEQARAAWQRGDPRAARPMLEQALAQDPPEPLRGLVRLTYGVVLREVGDTQTAIEQLQRCLDTISPDLADVCRGYALYNLGLAQRQGAYRSGAEPDTERLREAVRTYQQAAQEFRREGPPSMLRDTLQNLAWAACCGGVPTYATRALEESAPLCDTPESRWQQRIGEAFALIANGDAIPGMEICTELLAAQDSPPDVKSHAAWLAGDMALLVGRLTEADSLANQAVHWGSLAKDHRCLNDAAALRRRVSESLRQQTGA